MRKLLHLLWCDARELPALDPRPRPNVRNRVFSLSLARQVQPWLPSVRAAQDDFEDSVDSKRLVCESLNGILPVSFQWSRLGAHLQGIFSLENFPKWFICPWYGAPLPS
jgi:hypothetical protein